MSDQGINILVLGKTGVGKSSFCNYIFGEEIFLTGCGKPVTGWKEHFKYYSVKHENYVLNLYDSVGIEADNYERWSRELNSFLAQRSHTNNKNPLEWIHGVFYLINAASARIEDTEIELIRQLAGRDNNIPLNVVLTNSDAAQKDEIVGIRKALGKIRTGRDRNIDFDISEVCSVNIRTRSGVKENFGKDELLNNFIKSLDERLRQSIIRYSIVSYINLLEDVKFTLNKNIDKSDIGFFKLIYDYYLKDSFFDPRNIININREEVDNIFIKNNKDIKQLNYFLNSLGFGHSYSTKDSIDDIRARVDLEIDMLLCNLNFYFEKLAICFEHGGYAAKVTAAKEYLVFISDMKSYLKNVVKETINPTLVYLERERDKFV